MRVFEHPNLTDFKCPICGTSEDKEVVLIGIDGTKEGNNIQAEQFHLDCLELRTVSLTTVEGVSLIVQEFVRKNK